MAMKYNSIIPNPKERARNFEIMNDEWYNHSVVPYAQFLLDQTQARMSRHKIKFLHGNRETVLEVNGKIHRPLNDAMGRFEWGKKSKRYQDKFPELVKLFDLANDLEELFSLVLLVITPTTS